MPLVVKTSRADLVRLQSTQLGDEHASKQISSKPLKEHLVCVCLSEQASGDLLHVLLKVKTSSASIKSCILIVAEANAFIFYITFLHQVRVIY